jgi:hypothetical protein
MTDTETARFDADQAQRLADALAATSERLFQLILESDTQILKAVLRNPHLSDEHLLALLKRRDLPEELPKLIHQRRKNNLSHPLILALVKNPVTPGSLVRNLLPHLRLFELVDLCYLPGVTPDQRLAAERTIIQRLPTTPLGNKITLARRATATVVAELAKEGDSRTLEACLNSPRLKEAAVFQLISGANATATGISMVARHSRWQQRPNLRLAILKNRHTPAIWFTLWLPKLPAATINQLLASRRLSAQQKALVQTELKRRGSRK